MSVIAILEFLLGLILTGCIYIGLPLAVLFAAVRVVKLGLS